MFILLGLRDNPPTSTTSLSVFIRTKCLLHQPQYLANYWYRLDLVPNLKQKMVEKKIKGRA